MRILITAFDAFGGNDSNSSQMAVERLPDDYRGATLIKRILPTVYGEAARAVADSIDECSPQAVLCIGQAQGRSALTPERVAINVVDAPIADNAGSAPLDEPIDTSAPAAYFSTLPFKVMVAEMKAKGIPAAVSNTAGTFICNEVMFTALHHCAGTQTVAGFLHVPLATEQTRATDEVEGEETALPSLPLRSIVEGILCCIDAILEPQEARRELGGATH